MLYWVKVWGTGRLLEKVANNIEVGERCVVTYVKGSANHVQVGRILDENICLMSRSAILLEVDIVKWL